MAVKSSGAIDKALSAQRESKRIEFKQGFDPDCGGDWCEVIKDIVALANSGGGVLVFGLDDAGRSTNSDLTKLLQLDPADIQNRLGRYIGKEEIRLTIETPRKQKRQLIVWLIDAAEMPIIFEKPGTYPIDGGKQKTAFGEGTIYFRHGAKSEPGNNVDIGRSVSRYIDRIRKGWLTGMRQVVEAPIGATIAVQAANREFAMANLAQVVRPSDSPEATPVTLTRAEGNTNGVFLHEAVSDLLFSGINNVIDCNRLLFKGQGLFLMGTQIYYRVYSEREQVTQHADQIEKLLYSAIIDYMPALHWYSMLPPKLIASYLTDIFLWPKGNEMLTLLRLAPLLGEDFGEWLYKKLNSKWARTSQPPGFYHAYRETFESGGFRSPIATASKLPTQAQFELPDKSFSTLKDLLKDVPRCSAMLSQACLQVFEGRKEMKPLARSLDYLTYGSDIIEKRRKIGTEMMEQVGERLPEQDGEADSAPPKTHPSLRENDPS